MATNQAWTQIWSPLFRNQIEGARKILFLVTRRVRKAQLMEKKERVNSKVTSTSKQASFQRKTSNKLSVERV
jgi:hypothetical protein